MSAPCALTALTAFGLVAAPSARAQERIQNGGFETGTLAGWTLTGNQVNQSVSNAAGFAHSGNYGYRYGQVNSLGVLSQTFNTVAGTVYTFSFYQKTLGGTPNEFSAFFGGQQILDSVNSPTNGVFTHYSFSERAASSSTTISFGLRDDPAFDALDDVSVTANTAPLNPYYTSNAIIDYYVQGGATIGADSSGNLYNPTVSLASGGSTTGYVDTKEGTFNMTGGSVGSFIATENTSTLNISGGSVSKSIQSYNSSTVTVSGGTFSEGVFANDSSAVNISGGTFGQYSNNINFRDRTTGAFNFTGTGLSFVSLGADANVLGTDYQLTGLLQGGQSLNGDVINVQSYAKMFTFNGVPAPEPSQWASLGLGALGLLGLGVKARRRGAAQG